MLDARSALDGTPLLPLASATAVQKWRNGLPALRNETVRVPPGLKDILQPICTALAEAGAGDSAQLIGDAIAAGSIDADSLLGVSLARNQKAIRTSALHMGFSPDLVWLIGELGSAPLANYLSSSIVHGPSSIDDGQSMIDGGQSTIDHRPSTTDHHWNRGYCPFCGS